MMFKNITKKILAGMLALSLVVGGVVIVPSQAKAADRTIAWTGEGNADTTNDK